MTRTLTPVCPNCKRHGSPENRFRPSQVFDAEADNAKYPPAGYELRSALHLTCEGCKTTFPMFTYIVGKPDSLTYNAVDDNGEVWRGATEDSAFWFHPAPHQGLDRKGILKC